MAEPKDPSSAVASSSIAQEPAVPVKEEKEGAAPRPTGAKRVGELIKKAFDFCVEQWYVRSRLGLRVKLRLTSTFLSIHLRFIIGIGVVM